MDPSQLSKDDQKRLWKVQQNKRKREREHQKKKDAAKAAAAVEAGLEALPTQHRNARKKMLHQVSELKTALEADTAALPMKISASSGAGSGDASSNNSDASSNTGSGSTGGGIS